MKQFAILFVLLFLLPAQALAASPHAGRIYLQVEENGEAWYVLPDLEERTYLGRPQDAFNVMRGVGLGVSNENLAKIPVALLEGGGIDSDGDGLSDLLEDALGTDKNLVDTDKDTFLDKSELENGYDPLSTGQIAYDMSFVDSVKGKILLQVEQNGEAWYVNPEDSKRYFLGRPDDAYNIMRSVGIGISNTDLATIKQVDDPVFIDSPSSPAQNTMTPPSDTVQVADCGTALMLSYREEVAPREDRLADMEEFHRVYTCLRDAKKDCLAARGEISTLLQTSIIQTSGAENDCKIYYEISEVFIPDLIGMSLLCENMDGQGLLVTMSDYANCEGSLKTQTFPDGKHIPEVRNSVESITKVEDELIILKLDFEWHSDLGVSESTTTITITPEDFDYSSQGGG